MLWHDNSDWVLYTIQFAYDQVIIPGQRKYNLWQEYEKWDSMKYCNKYGEYRILDIEDLNVGEEIVTRRRSLKFFSGH